MDHSKLKRRAIKLSATFVLFLVSLFVSNIVLNRGNTDMTSEMSGATLPIVYMNVNDEYINPLHGYVTEMEGNFLRGSITPLMANRSVSFRVDLYNAVIAKVSYEVRPVDMSRLIEETEISDYTHEGDSIFATAVLKDLIEDDVEYMLIIKLTTSGGDVVRYYARVINRAELYLTEKMEFVRDFSDRTFNREAAATIKKNMESNAEGDNSSYAYVNIHSSFNQLTWGDLEPVLVTDKDMELLEIDEISASIMLKYQVEIMSETHNVSEFFRVQRGKRMYLMEYERIMDQVFDEDKNVVVNGKILHGMINEKLSRIENDSGSIYAFVQQNGLYSYNISSQNLARLFSFCDKENNDARTRYDAHSIRPLRIDGVGNIWFIVYGYMNRGINEGKMGVALYYYDCALNTIEEELFIPYSKSYEILAKDIESLAYISTRNRMYILLDGSVYSINIGARESEVMQDSISETGFFSSDDESTIAWQTGDTIIDYTEIQLFKLDSMTPSVIPSAAGEIVIPLGFMDNDVIYGAAKVSDVTTDYTGKTMIPMYCVKVQDQNGNVLKDYRYEGIYVTGVEKVDNMLILSRVAKDPETGVLTPIEDDQIVNNKTKTSLKNVLSAVVTEKTETTYQTVLYKANDSENPSLKITNPKGVVFEGSRDVRLSNEDHLKRYYVYAKGDLSGIYTSESEAVSEAAALFGVVTDKRMAYIWESGNRKTSAKLTDLEISSSSKAEGEPAPEEETTEETIEEVAEEVSSAYVKCVDTMLQYGGVYKSAEEEIRTKSLVRVLSDNLDADVLDLSGCSLSDVLYYISRGYPVMAMTGEGNAVIIIGYDSKNTILYDPGKDSIYKYGMNDSANMFEQAGNRFVTYVR
ncbi:MAG: C39 family peptidase [Lachnospiraceae bacterium]|nr:C39 family peptidase [Lachnospiraceae bacterium]